MNDMTNSLGDDPEYIPHLCSLIVRSICIIDDDELFEMWVASEVDRIARYSSQYLPR